mgnify:CR=1 FL=1|jgi:uncharacterized protein YdiU (UPF0061 family)
MKLLEGLKDYDNNMATAIKAMVTDQLGLELSDEEVRVLVNNLGLSDILAIDTALENEDLDALNDILSAHIELDSGNA